MTVRAAALAAALCGCAATAPPLVTARVAPEPVAPLPDPAGAYGVEGEAQPTALEARALDAVRARAAGGAMPRVSPALTRAARALALGQSEGEPLDHARIREALARGLSYDPAPAARAVARPPGEVIEAIAALAPREPATHLGVGAIERDGLAYLVLLSVERRATLSPFPPAVAAGAQATLSGRLAPGLLQPRVFVGRPSGDVEEVDATGGSGFRARVTFPSAGRHVVEVVASGAAGPTVVAILTVTCGSGAGASPPPPADPGADPADAAAAEVRVIDAINATRRRHGRPPVAPAPEVAEVARRHSAEMLARGTVAHVLPGTGDAAGRLLRAHVAYRRAFENVARAQTALAAHLTAEESPAHLANLLAPGARSAGVGIARGVLSTGAPVVYLTEILIEPPDDGRDSPLTPDARVKEILWRERERAGAPPLTVDPRLDGLARDAALAMRDRGEPDAGDLPARALRLGRGLAAADVFVASAPAEAERSANVRDARFRRVGVGVAAGDSARFGAQRLFIAVVYTD
ncbi:MAG TPA: CAP domain-containing protein [Anaeromyxobacteraceae bacterium]|nr:CAP domain-containing protein [Anaeromyxobacteraceae bacterium]